MSAIFTLNVVGAEAKYRQHADYIKRLAFVILAGDVDQVREMTQNLQETVLIDYLDWVLFFIWAMVEILNLKGLNEDESASLKTYFRTCDIHISADVTYIFPKM